MVAGRSSARSSLTTLDPNTLIAPVQAQVKAATGPRPHRARRRAHRAVAASAGRPDATSPSAMRRGRARQGMIEARALELAVALLPLLSRRFELEEIALVRPRDRARDRRQGPEELAVRAAPARRRAAPADGGGLAGGRSRSATSTINDGVVTYRDGPKAARQPRDRSRRCRCIRARCRSEVAIEFRGAVGDVPVALEGTRRRVRRR